MRYFKTLYGKSFDIDLSKLLLEANCLIHNRSQLASCYNTGCFECSLGDDKNCTAAVLGFIEQHKSKELLEQACENMTRFAIIEDKLSRSVKNAKLCNCYDLPGIDSFCQKEECIFYDEDLEDCRPVRAAWLKDKVRVYNE